MTYKLYYFPIRARAEAIKMMLAYAKIDCEIVTITFSEWPAFVQSEKSPSGQIPLLECVESGKILTQSHAILKFLGSKHNLTSTDPWDSARLDEIHDFCSDIRLGIFKILFSKVPKTEQEQTLKKHTIEVFPKQVTTLAKLLKSANHGDGYFILGSQIKWADFVLHETLGVMDFFAKGAFSTESSLVEFYKAVGEKPELSEFMANRLDIFIPK